MSSKSFCDPIHGFIDVDPIELKIINSSPFQRLRHIRQLGTFYLVYHGAEHTRFGHSLGVMHLASKAFDSAVKNYQERYQRALFDEATCHHYRRILRNIALVHDLGHPPFSHAGEGVFAKGLKHEHFTKRILLETEIAGIIRESGDITPELIWLIYGEKDAEAFNNPLYRMPDFKFLKSFMDSDLDCDKMDYLLRDSHYSGVNYGKYDATRLIDSLNIYHEKGVMQLAVERGGLHAFEEFVIARYFMFIQMYFHRLVYLIQTKGVDLGYEYGIHFYGPYSEDINQELISMCVDGAVDFHVLGQKHEIAPSDKPAEMSLGSKDLELADQIIRQYKNDPPYYFELITTAHFVAKNMSNTDEGILSGVTMIKGDKYPIPMIQQAIGHLRQEYAA